MPNYYEMKAKAIQQVGEFLDKKKPIKKIYYYMAVTYGFSKKFVDDTVELIKQQNG